MQQLQHKRFTTRQAEMQLWSALSSLAMRHSYVPVGSGFIAIENKTNDDKIRPWFER
jgi:hypothetical protein